MEKAVIKNGKEKQLIRRHPWVFPGAISKAPSANGFVKTVTCEGKFIAYGWYDPLSHIPLRLVSWDENNEPDEEFFPSMVKEAIARRANLGLKDTDCYRLVHGEADMLPGVAIDVYGDFARIICSARVAWQEREMLVKAVMESLPVKSAIVSTDPSFCGIEGLKEESVSFGEVPAEPIVIAENGLKYAFLPGTGQKSGFYCDQRDNRMAVEKFAAGRSVLDAFCYSGGFTLHCLRGGALSVTAMDSSQDALDLVKGNLSLNGFSLNNVELEKCNIFERMRSLEQDRYDLMVLDPPKLAETRHQTENALRAYKDLNRLAMLKIRNGGLIATFSCSGAVDRETFRMMLAWAAKDSMCDIQILSTLGQGADHPIRLSFPESEYLKGYILRVVR